MLEQVEQYLDQHRDAAVEQLKQFLRIPSVSADSRHKDDCTRAAEFVRDRLVDAGVEAELVKTQGHPIVYGSWRGAKEAPTVLVYGHYDVQPPDPLNDWTTPPFEPTIRGKHIFARGATDDKGQMLTHVLSVAAWLKSAGKLPLNVIFVIEGEEEVGSRNLDDYLEQNREKLRCDIVVVSDSSQYAPGMPAITYGIRGIIACEVTLSGPKQDLHSGLFGGSVANPVNALCHMIAQLHDSDGRVRVPGFYDDVVPLSANERASIANLPFDDASFLKGLGVDAGWGEVGYNTNERRWARPTCDVNGIFGGYMGEGPKTIVPAKATAKITCRLVPNQNPEKITNMLGDFLEKHVRPGLKMDFKVYHGGSPLVFDTGTPFMAAAGKAIKRAFGAQPVFVREGGSIPIVSTFRELLGVDTLLLGWGQNTDNLHSPNEHFNLEDFHKGTAASAALWWELSRK